jgi:hypothetical protein
MPTSYVCALVAALVFALLPPPAAAGESDETPPAQADPAPTEAAVPDPPAPERTAWIAPTLSSDDAAVVTDLLGRLRPAVVPDSPPVHLAELLVEGTWEAGFAGLGAAAVEFCAGDPVDADAYRASLDRLVQATVNLEDTEPIAAAIRASWACLSEPLAADQLAEVDFLAAAAIAADRSRAEGSAFDQVFVVAPDYPFDKDLAPRIYAAFLDARDRVGKAPRTAASVVVSPGASIWIDGVAVPTRTAELVAGRHLVQVRVVEDQPLVGMVVTVQEARETLILDRQLLLGAAVEDADYGARLQRLLTALHADGQPVRHLVVLSENPQVFRWDSETTTTKRLLLPARLAAPVGRAVKTRRALGGAMIGVGAATAVAGAIVAGVSFSQAETLKADMESDYGLGLLGAEEYAGYWRTNDAGWALVGVGGVVLAAGIPISVIGPRGPTADAEAAVLNVSIGPVAARVGISGSF